jgi:HEAT repeat protein
LVRPQDLKDPVATVRWRAAETLGNIGPGAKPAVPALLEALKDEDGSVRVYAAQALEKIYTPEARKTLEEYKKKSE